MPTTTRHGLQTPTLSSANDVPADLAILADQIDGKLPQGNEILIGGKIYPKWGLWQRRTLGSPTRSSGDIHAWTVSEVPPFSAPQGWRFLPFLAFTSGFTSVGAANIATGSAAVEVRVINAFHNAPTIQLGWTLVPAS